MSRRIPETKRKLRSALRATVQILMTLRSRPLPIPAGPILVIAPHQDDCTLGCGGLMFQARLAGESVHIIYLTDGSASHGGHPIVTPDHLALIRQAEAREAKSRVYVDSACLNFLNLQDGHLPHLTAEERESALSALGDHITRISPSVILLPFRKDGSTEHEAGFALITAAIARARVRPRILEYPVWATYRPLHLIMPALFSKRVYRFKFKGYGAHKRHALNAYVSQFKPAPPWLQPVMPADFTRCFEREDEFFFELET